MKSDTAKIGQLLPQTESQSKTKSFFKKHRALLIVGFVGTALFGSALVCSVAPSSFPSDQEPTPVQPANAPEARLKPSYTTKRVVGYYSGADEVNTEQLQKLTHVIFEYVKLDLNETLKFESETSEKRLWELIKKAREVNKDLKVMVSLGGWDQSWMFHEFVNDPFGRMQRRTLIYAIGALIKEFGIDGVDIFWIHIDSISKQNYLEFVQDLRKSFVSLGKETSPLISVVVTPFWDIRENRYLWKDLMEEVEFMNVLTHDFFNTKWHNYIGPTAPIYGGTRENVDSTMKYITCKTGSSQKLNLIVGFYGSYWTDVTLPFSKDNFTWITPERYREDWDLYKSDLKKFRVRFRNLDEFLNQWPGAEYHYHNASKSSYYWIEESKTFITIENEESLREKVNYQNRMNIGGIGAMTIEDDDYKNRLLNVIAAEERKCLTDKDYEVKYDC